VLGLPFHVTDVSVYVPPLPSQSDRSLAFAEGAPMVINVPSPIAAAVRTVGPNLVKAVVVMRSFLCGSCATPLRCGLGSMVAIKWCFSNGREASFHS
jgi:hypothetical protein